MAAGLLAGITWALETVLMGFALASSPFLSTQQAMLLSPFVSTFLHDLFSALWVTGLNTCRGDLPNVVRALRTRSGKFVALAALVGGPVGMTGYVLAIRYLGSAVGAVAGAIYPAVGAVLARLFLREKMAWYRWLFLLGALGGVYAISYAPDPGIVNFKLGVLGAAMCAFGWGTEAVILTSSLRNEAVKQPFALQIRQSVSALAYGAVILPILGGWRMTAGLFAPLAIHVLALIAAAALCAAVSYLFYYKALAGIGAAKAMALNITYAAWAVVFTAVAHRDLREIRPLTLVCTLVVLVCAVLSAADLRALAAKK